MPERETLERALADKHEGKSPSTQAGEFIREEIHNVREGIHGARSAKQVIAIGLSKARRAGVKLPLPRKGSVPEQTRRQARRELERGRHQTDRPSPKRSRAVLQALRREDTAAASTTALSRHARQIARQKTAAERSATARKAARTRREIHS